MTLDQQPCSRTDGGAFDVSHESRSVLNSTQTGPDSERQAISQTLPSAVVGLVSDEGGQKFSCLFEALLVQKCPSKLELGQERPSLFERCHGKLFGHGVVRQLVGNVCRFGEQDGIHHFTRPLPQHRQLEEMCWRAAAFQSQDVGKLPIDLSTEEGGHLSSENLSEQRMSKTNARNVLVDDGNQPSPFEVDEGPSACHLFSHPEREWFPNGEQLQESAPGICQASKASGNSPLEARSRTNTAGPTPHSADLSELARFHNVGKQLPSKEDVAAGRIPHSLQGDVLHDAVEGALEHLVEL